MTALPFGALLLTLAPGGMSQLVIVAFVLGVDPAFVTTHQALRIILVIVAAPALFRLWMRWKCIE